MRNRIKSIHRVVVILAVLSILGGTLMVSPVSAQDPPPTPTPIFLPDEFDGEIFDCDRFNTVTGDGNALLGSGHVGHECADNHTHSSWNAPGTEVLALYTQWPRAHRHSVPPVSAENVGYVPQEVVPGPSFYIDAPVPSGIKRCDASVQTPSPYRRDEAWGILNCEVKRSVEFVVAATVGVALFGVAWSGIHIISAGSSEGRGRGKQLLWAAVVGVIVAMCCYIIASMIDLGISLRLPWDIVVPVG